MSDMRWLTPISSGRAGSRIGYAHYIPYTDTPALVRSLCGNGPFNTGFARVVVAAPFCLRCQGRLAAMERE